MSSPSQYYTTREVTIRYTQGEESSKTLRFSISYKHISEPYDDETLNLVLNILDKETLDLVTFRCPRKKKAHYYFEYSSEEYVDAYRQELENRGKEIEAEFGIQFKITSGCATEMRIVSTDQDLTVPLLSEQALDPLDVAAIRVFTMTMVNNGGTPSTVGAQATLLQALSRFGRKNQTPRCPFSLTMLADPKQRKVADQWVERFRNVPIPMKPPLCSEIIAPPVSGMISPPV